MAAAGLTHERERGLRAVEEAEDVDLDHPAPVLGVRALDRPEQHHARVVHEDVEAAELGLRLPDERVRLLLVGHVELAHQRPAAVRLDPSPELLQPVHPPRAERDRGALSSKGHGRRLADARRRPGDSGHPAF